MTPIVYFLRRRWKPLLISVIALTLIIRGDYYRIDRNHWRQVASVLRLDLDAIKSAQESARQLAEAKKRADQTQYDQLAERADNAERKNTDLRRAADRYASANRVRQKAVGGSASGPSGTGSGEAAGGGDGPGSDASVVVSRTDFDTLVGNTIRLKRVHDFGNDLIVAGLAEKSQ